MSRYEIEKVIFDKLDKGLSHEDYKFNTNWVQVGERVKENHNEDFFHDLMYLAKSNDFMLRTFYGYSLTTGYEILNRITMEIISYVVDLNEASELLNKLIDDKISENS